MGKRQQQVNKKIITPIQFVDKETYKFKPFYSIEDHPNDHNKFAILSTTENGKYVVGGMLHFNFNGVDIYTDINNAIFVDLSSKIVFIKDYILLKEQYQYLYGLSIS